ncbi:MAG TPA: LysM domain-containing protein [Acidimicrobiales bacterium]|nr:LysM domain-containing protein [Acidimicrobiales bacterium]
MALALVDDHPRPALRLIRGGLDARPSAAVYRRRRAVALVLALVVVVATMAGLQAALRPLADWGPESSGDRPLSGPDHSAPVAAGHETVLVQPGDTLWTIARDLRPSGDLRPVVDQLAALNGGASLEAGQTIVLPG